MNRMRTYSRMLLLLTAPFPALAREAGPRADAGPGYFAILPGKILLAAAEPGPDTRLAWRQTGGPARAELERPDAAVTWARATEPGRYEFTLTATRGAASAGINEFRVVGSRGDGR